MTPTSFLRPLHEARASFCPSFLFPFGDPRRLGLADDLATAVAAPDEEDHRPVLGVVDVRREQEAFRKGRLPSLDAAPLRLL